MGGPRVVVIGAGVVGAALADELSALGWTDVTVVEQGPLPAPGGSTSHAPGLVFQTNPSRTMTALARYTVDKLCSLDVDGPCFLQVGGLEVATTQARLADLHRRAGWAGAGGVAAEVIGPQECLELWPFLDPRVVLGGLHVPTDGLAKAVRAVEAQLRRAAARGVRVLERTEVLDVLVSAGRVTGVVTSAGELAADVVVCCAGIWGQHVAAMAGMTLPLTPLAHQLAWTGPVPALAGATQEATRPVLRHQEGDLYYRERFDTLGIGYYGHRPMPVDVADILGANQILGADRTRGMPSVRPFTQDDFAPAWEATLELLPPVSASKVDEGINGLFSFTTDDLPLLGPSPDVDGFWVAEAVWVTHSAGVGRAMAEWIVQGRCSSFDLHECDVNRFDPHQLTPAYVVERSCQNFVEVYDVKHPLEPMTQPRPLRVSPFHVREVELGAVFLEASGWERPQWYEANAPLVDGRDVPAPDPWAARFWSPIVAAEAQVTRERVGLFDMSTLRRLSVTGPGAEAFLQRTTTGDVGRGPGSVTYCLLLDDAGLVRSDVTVARLSPTEYQVGVNSPLDLDWLRRHLPADGSVEVRDVTPGTCCLGLWGPRARDVLQPLTSTDLSTSALPYFRGTRLDIGHVPALALRLSYVGELGWELYTTADLGLTLWDTLWAAGARHGMIAAGRGAFTSLRLEKGYRAFGTDLTFEHDPWEAGLGFAVRAAKEGFVGREAVLARKDDVTRRLVCLTLDDPRDLVLGKEPVFDGDSCVGYVTSAAYGYTSGTSIAYAWVPAELADPGRKLSVAWFDRRLAATVTAEPIVDPGMERLRS